MSVFPLPTRKVGDFTVTAVSDGSLTVSLDLLSNIDPAEALRMQQAAGVTEPAAIPISGYLVRGKGRTVLIDAGTGGIKPGNGKLKSTLRLAGVDPREIEAILVTHAHPDHVGGLTEPSGDSAFPNAELVVHQREVAFWQNEGHFARASERARDNFQIARRAFECYRDRLRSFDVGEVLPGITAMPLPGHTAGHTGYRLDSGGESLLAWGDIVHFPQIQIARPEVSIAFDQDATVAVETRSRLLDLVSAEKLVIAGMHLGEPGFARIERRGKSYRALYEG
jgi:glyoxylase-like metal-dependent hydrolase (beta-lactamase superfamily II)